MRAFLKTYCLLMIAVLTACSGEFQTYDLAQDNMAGLHVKASGASSGAEEVELKRGVPASGYYRGDLLGGSIWWARKGITIDKEEDFIVIAEGVGPESTPFGATFPPLDFAIEKMMIKVVARVEGESQKDVELVLQLQDGNGFVTNKKRPSIVIKNSDDTEEYYFLLDDAFEQVEPEVHAVNSGFINSIQLFINPGGEPYTGKIYLDELRVVAAKAPE